MTSQSTSHFNNPHILSAAECAEIAEMMQKKHIAAIGERTFAVSNTQDRGLVDVKIELASEDRTYAYPVEARMDLNDDANIELSGREASLFLMDYIDVYFEEYFKDLDTYLPIDWSPYEKEGLVFFMKGQILNPHLESLADKLLGANS